MFEDRFKELVPLLRARGLNRHIARIWVYKRICLVVDFVYKDIPFAFDFMISNNGAISIDIVQRRSNTDFRVTDIDKNKERIAQDMPRDQALDLFYDKTLQILTAVDKYHSDSGKSFLEAQVSLGNAANLNTKPENNSISMKIGILTLPFNSNIGGNLQGYALMEVLRQLGHNPILINRRHPTERSRDTASSPDTENALIVNKFPMLEEPNRTFVEKHALPISGLFDSSLRLSKNIDRYGFDAIIVGSDQVWRPRYARAILPDFFLNFLPKDDNRVKRISYAASFGTPHWEYDAEQTRMVASLIRRFDAISVREDSGIALCRHHLGVDAEHVLDPTLLLPPDHYAQLSSAKRHRPASGQIICYILDRSNDKARIIASLSKKLAVEAYSTDGLPFVSANTSNSGDGDRSVEGWLAAFNEAAFVVTDSFHGTVFSILFNKPFIAYGNPGRGMARFTSLLKMVGLEDRLVTTSSNVNIQKMVQPIDWKTVNERLAKYREQSFDFLRRSLSGENSIPEMDSSAAIAKVGEVLNVKPEFVRNNTAWSVSRTGSVVVLAVADGEAKLGNIIWCDFPELLQGGAQYRLTIRWSVHTTSPTIKPCIRNPKTGRVHVLATLPVEKSMVDMHTDTIAFSPPDAGFSQFVLGAASFSGKNGGAKIEAITLQKIGEAPKGSSISSPPRSGYAEKARELALVDSERYANAFVRGNSIGGIRARLMYAAHAIEKGLSHSNFRAGFGKTAIESLANEMRKWLAKDGNIDDPFFKSGISVMHSYFERHRRLNVDVSRVYDLFLPKIRELIAEADDTFGGVLAAGANREPIVSVEQGRTFLDVVYSRRSVREFTTAPVRIEDIQHAVQIASQAPSVCNRQGPRVHHFSDPQQIRALVDMQRGFSGYKKPPTLLLVTCDLTAFTHAKERNQAFIDGGLFLMGLLLGLEQVGLGACALNTTMEAERERDIRKALNISEEEVLISFVAVGYYDPAVLVPRSVRYPVDNLLFLH